jgi:small subunit ribosomal protein S13
MVRILGVILQKHKKINIALTAIFGIGLAIAKQILIQANINPNLKVSELSDTDVFAIRKILENNTYKIGGELKQFIKLNIKHLIMINSYKGKRHLKGLPVNGQRTRTNSRTTRKLVAYNSKN